jgi:hypothetical protein
VEEHAWTFGGSCSTSLLVPPQVRSLKSKAGLKNKIWFIESMTRAAKAVVRLKERHGIYVDEWEGEKATDKQLVLELKAIGSRDVKIVQGGMIDEYTLKLNYDSRGLPTQAVPLDQINKELEPLAQNDYSKKVKDLSKAEREALLTQLAAAKGYIKGEKDGMTVLRFEDTGMTYADVETGRLILNETGTNL